MRKPQSQALQATSPPGDDGPKIGRPSTFTEAVASLICVRIASGETLTAICQTPGLPATQTVYQWRRQFPSFAADYAAARIDQMEAWSDEIIAISDDSSMDTVTKRDPKGREYEAIDHENIQRSRLMVDTRKWIMAKVGPAYADRVDHVASGEVVHTVQLSDRERMRRLVSFMLQDQQLTDGAVIDSQAVALPASGNSSHPAKPDGKQ